MEKEKDAQTEEETAEETRKIQVAYALMFFLSQSILSFSVSLLSSSINAPRYQQSLHSQMDHNCNRLVTQKAFVNQCFGQNSTFLF
jgi:hypothetical protein